MFRNLVLTAACGLAVFSWAPSLDAATIATWTFETSLPSTAGPIGPEVGAGSATAVHAAPQTFSSPSGNGSSASYSTNSWTVGDYYQFQISTVGETGITFAWDQTRSSSGPGFVDPSSPNFKLQYSTDGTSFTDHTNYLVPTGSWSSSSTSLTSKYSQDLSAVTALDNQAAVYFRLTSILGDQPTSTTGTSRVDNVSVTSIPEPATAALGLIGLVAAAARRRRR